MLDTWIGLSDAGLLSAAVAAPVEVDMNAGFPVAQGNRSGQNAPPQRSSDQDHAAVVALDLVAPISDGSLREIGGTICVGPRGFYQAAPKVSGASGGRLDFTIDECGRIGTTVAAYHTHPRSGNAQVDSLT